MSGGPMTEYKDSIQKGIRIYASTQNKNFTKIQIFSVFFTQFTFPVERERPCICIYVSVSIFLIRSYIPNFQSTKKKQNKIKWRLYIEIIAAENVYSQQTKKHIK